MGLEFENVVLSPFLNNGITFAIFSLSGNIPVVSIWFTMSVIGLTRFSLIDLGKVFDNPTHPVLFYFII